MLNGENLEIERLKEALKALTAKIEQQEVLLQELRNEQDSLAEWVRGLEQVQRNLPIIRESDTPSSRYLFQNCTVHISENNP